MMEELKDLEELYAHEGLIVARERFKNMIFRYRVMTKLQKLKELNKESYEYTKAHLEI